MIRIYGTTGTKITVLNKELKSHTSLKSTIDEIYSDIDLISYTLETILG